MSANAGGCRSPWVISQSAMGSDESTGNLRSTASRRTRTASQMVTASVSEK